MIRVFTAAFVVTALHPAMMRAQDSAAAAPQGCAVLNGIRISARWDDSATATGAAANRAAANRPGANRTGVLVDARTTIDTTLRFDIGDRRWTRRSLDAMVAAGASGRASAPWRACVGIVLGMEQPTIVLRGVRGQMHLKVDLSPLARIPGSGLADSSRQNSNRR